MSSDENDPDNDRYFYSVRPHWRNEQITRWLHGLDHIHSQKYDGDSKLTHYRRPSEKVDTDCSVVKELPLNFYDRNYLDGLEESQYESLGLRSSVSLEFCPSIQRYVSALSGSQLSDVIIAFCRTGMREFLVPIVYIVARNT